MSRVKEITLAAGICVCGLLTAGTVAAADADKFDIVGLTLGMTPEDALKALRAHGVNEESINESRLAYNYSDGLKHDYRTEDFTYMIVGHVDGFVDGKRRTDTFNLFFSPPPDGGRLVAVSRTIENNVDPVTRGQFRDALVGKYGEPDVKDSATVHWKFGGGTENCFTSIPNHIGFGIPGKDSSILGMIFARSGNQYMLDRFSNRRVTSLDDCASMLEYRIGLVDDQPATRVSAQMIDVKGWAKAELAASEWVEGLRQDAVRKREGAGNKPAL